MGEVGHADCLGPTRVLIAWFGRVSLCLTLLAGPVAAQVAPTSANDGFLATLGRAFKFRHDPVVPKDFVVKSRSSAPRKDFMPVGVTPPEHDLKAKTQQDVQGTTATLEALRAGHDRLSGRPAGGLRSKVAKRARLAKSPAKPVNAAPNAN